MSSGWLWEAYESQSGRELKFLDGANSRLGKNILDPFQ